MSHYVNIARDLDAPSIRPWNGTVLAGAGFACILASVSLGLVIQRDAQSVAHSTVRPLVPQVTMPRGAAHSAVLRAHHSQNESTLKVDNARNADRVYNVDSRSQERPGTQPQAPPQSPLRFWLTIPGIAIMAGCLMGYALARVLNTKTQAPCMAMATTAGSKEVPGWGFWNWAKSKEDVANKVNEQQGYDAKVYANYKPRKWTKRFPAIGVQRLRVRMGQSYEKRQKVFMDKLGELYPGAMLEMPFLAKATQVMNSYGFNKQNSIGLISVCRDELTRTLVEDFEDLWGPSFSSGSLAGMAFLGKTGMGAGMAHAPQDENGVERYIFICGPHISISETGEVGKVYRPGRENISCACGALIAMQSELQNQTLSVGLKTMDLELSMMKQQLAETLTYGDVPTLDQLTKKAQVLIKQQMENILDGMNLKGRTEYVFISGVQVHAPENATFFWPKDMYVQHLDGRRTEITVEEVQNADAKSLLHEIYEGDLSKVMFLAEHGDEMKVRQWVEDGGDINAMTSSGMSVLLTACRYGHKSLVKYLLENGANPNLTRDTGRSALQDAMELETTEIADNLKKAGAVLSRDAAELYMWRAAIEGNLRMVQRVIKYGPMGLANIENDDGETPLFVAVRHLHSNVARFLIAQGADTNHINNHGETVQQLAKTRNLTDLGLRGQTLTVNQLEVQKKLAETRELMKTMLERYDLMSAELKAIKDNME